MKRSCETCEWWEQMTFNRKESPIQNVGECRCRPPTEKKRWVQTWSDQWCREWTKKVEETK